jgi:Putative Actinobacterial Holin-X, holin superfamily III
MQLQTNGARERQVPSVTDSLDRMVDAAQKVVADEVSLLGVEVSSGISAAFQSTVLLLLGTVLLAVGWVLVLMAAFQALAPRVGGLSAFGLLAVCNLVPGIVLLVVGRGRLKDIANG